MEKVKFGIIGIGNMGSAHVVNINNLKNCELTAVCDIDPEAFNRIDEGIRSRLQLFTDPEKFLKEAEIDARHDFRSALLTPRSCDSCNAAGQACHRGKTDCRPQGGGGAHDRGGEEVSGAQKVRNVQSANNSRA